MTTVNPTVNLALVHRTRITYGIVLLAVGFFIYLIFGLNTEAGLQTTFGLNLAGSQALTIPDLVVPARLTVILMAGIAVFFGALHLARGIRSTGVLIGVIAATFVVASSSGRRREIVQPDRHDRQFAGTRHSHCPRGVVRGGQ
jgi:hypothetical protein